MDCKEYYNINANNNKRSLEDGTINEKNAHNFIKSVLISTFTHRNNMVLDLGCGKGGDILKFLHCSISKYVGVDNSKKSLEVCVERFKCKKLYNKIDYKLCEDTLWSESGFGSSCFDTISCQFALHYAFDTPKSASISLCNIYNALKSGGKFIATIPISKVSYIKRVAEIPGYKEQFLEPTVSQEELCDKINEAGFQILLFENFKPYYEKIYKENTKLCKIMKADVHPPKDDYFVLACEKS